MLHSFNLNYVPINYYSHDFLLYNYYVKYYIFTKIYAFSLYINVFASLAFDLCIYVYFNNYPIFLSFTSIAFDNDFSLTYQSCISSCFFFYNKLYFSCNYIYYCFLLFNYLLNNYCIY